MPKSCAVPYLIAALLLTACGKGKDKEKEAAKSEAAVVVQAEAVTRGPINLIIESDAVLYPVEQASVTSKISAPVRRVLVNRGDHVKAGQLLAELESRDLQATAQETHSLYEQAQASLQTTTGATVPEDRAKSEADVQATQQALEAAKKVYESRARLQKEGALAQKLVDDAKVAMVQAQSQYDTARSHLNAVRQVTGAEQIKGAQAQVAAAKARHDSAAVQVAYAQVLSPIGGVVSDRPVYPGEMAASGASIVSIVNISRVVARANIPLKQVAFLKTGSPATITGTDGTLTGRVTVVSPAVNAGTTTVEVWVEAENPGERMRPGGTVRVAIRADVVPGALLIPAPALLSADEGGEKVLVIGADSKVHSHRVTVGIREGTKVQITAGVNEGDSVVTSGGLGLEDGAKVTLKAGDDKTDDKADDKK